MEEAPDASQPSPDEGRTICVALDGSHASQEALRWALSDLFRPRDRLRLLNVIPPSVSTDLSIGAGRAVPLLISDCQPDPRAVEGAKELLAAATTEATRFGVPEERVEGDVLVSCGGFTSGEVARTLVYQSQRCNCDTIVIGSRGLTAGQRAMFTLLGLGSVAEHVVKHASSNVAVHKPAPKTVG